ncbi:MAG: TAXI family TRAP transporter solute-binding subunit [Alphaproteobacteria bacterium]|nr:TAXI family TRAP transporter solute-binding subunit [Alphaproteobacteria bacterium]
MTAALRLTAIIILLAGLALGSAPASAESIKIGTGSTAGVYFQVGRAICHMLGKFTAARQIACESPPTAGSISNLRNLRAGNLQIGVAQSDWQFHALYGTGPFAEAGPDNGLRALFSVHGEPLTLVARRDAGIAKLDDLSGKRVNMGNPGSGQRATMEVVMAAKGWTADTFSMADALGAFQMSMALCHDRIQAMVYTVGHPNGAVGKAAELCDAVIVEVKDAVIDKLVAENPYYAYTTVPGGLYPGNPDPTTTFGVKATVVTSADLPDDVAYAIVETVFANLDAFKSLHPAFAALEARAMTVDGLSAPLHPGAARYFREAGLM